MRTNAERVADTARLLETHSPENDSFEQVTDVLTDLQHYCHLHALDFHAALRIASDHFRHEYTEEEDQNG